MARIARPLLCLGTVCFVAVVAFAQTSSTPARTASSAAIDQTLERAVAQHDVPGVVALVVDRRGVLYQKAVGVADAGTGRPIAADAVFRIASMTKPITSIAAMQLIEQHRLSLDDAASKYLPELGKIPVVTSFDAQSGRYTTSPPSHPVTIRHLMTHTSGFGYGFTSPITRDFKPRADDPLASLTPSMPGGTAPLLFEPGSQWVYGTSTDWLGRVVEQVSGQTLDAFLRAHVLDPLRMTDTTFAVPEPARPRVPAVHRRATGDAFASTPATFPTPTSFSGGGGLSATAADYGRFIRMVLNDGTLDGARIVTAETIRAMSSNQIGKLGVRALKSAQPQLSADFTFINDDRDKWGLGFLISTEPAAGKRAPGSLSWGGINNTWFWIDPANGIGGVFMSQLLPFADGRVLSTYDAFERAVYAAFGGAARR
jgi:methyl acetate hydrolase